MGIKMRKEVKWFAELMEEKLKKNDWKSHWKNASFEYLFGRIVDETEELYFAEGKEKIDECVDIANLVMMIADNCKKMSDGD